MATYTSKSAEKLRRQNSAARTISVFIVAKGENHSLDFRHGAITKSGYFTLPVATSSTNELIKPALQIVDSLLKKENPIKNQV